mmetsp:Transcript_12386/g.14934  ORF Transcript_12386/g.14934 Transcript_12386/m.14934 type:complete len:174 (+) Transcript_12386:109-630(+)|eukprot:CAMPEP_0195292934 /NCGR_PEP_ID=MMETSP0707-20130614/11251_1 /TAXON_ID=33640 /ORGANISM="Asterionellopsis glacialis, Strain CCMP134" /LENGTH=173 /DNA_ID=CAMNT_0040353531 /DNA_START=145 /DNA_END=666 /DNA_ORIENTATION=-
MTTSPMASIVGSAVALCIICALGLYANLNEHRRRQEEMCVDRRFDRTSTRRSASSGKRLNADNNPAQSDTEGVQMEQQTQNNIATNKNNCIISNTADYLTGLATMAMLDEKAYFLTALVLALIFCTILLLSKKESGTTTNSDPNVGTYVVRCLLLVLLWSYRFGEDFVCTQGN